MKLYGIERTLIKVRGQYHMKKSYQDIRDVKVRFNHTGRVALIGCGNYAFSNIAYYVNKYQKASIKRCMDVDINRAASLCEAYRAHSFSDDVYQILKDSGIDTVFISSNHASHATYAIQCIEAGKHVHIEKPHVVSKVQLMDLRNCMKSHPDIKVFLGFNRPRSPLFKNLVDQINHQSGPYMINWFIAGHEIPDDHWYFRQDEGGRVLGNLCHWTDLTLHLIGLDHAFPCTIQSVAPQNPKSDFVFSVLFADSSCATITFSAKGHTFEGVREVLNVHRGNILANITDFQKLTIENVDQKYSRTLIYRDHGHSKNIMNTMSNTKGESPRYVYLTASFFLAFKEALDTGEAITLIDDYQVG
jgi:predicted dehydrogenase